MSVNARLEGEFRARRPASRRALSALPWLAIAAVVLLVSLVLMRRRPAIAGEGDEPARYAGSRGVLALAPVLPAARLPEPVRVTLVRDPASVAYYDDTTAYDRELARWREELEATGATVTVRAPSALVSTREPLIVPAAPCLSADTRRAITDAATSGRGVALTWMTGTRDGGCRAVGWGFLADVTGAGRIDTMPSGVDTYVVPGAATPLGIALPPGARLSLMRANHVALRTSRRDVRYADEFLNPAGADTLLDAAVARGVRPRVAYVGFTLGTVVDNAWNRGLARLLVRNVAAHVAGVPLAAPDAWPGGHEAAAVIAQDVEDQFVNASATLDTLRALRVPATFYVVSSLARQHDDLTRDLARYGELGTHTSDHRRLGGAPAADQLRRLQLTQSELRELAGSAVAGLRPPEEQFDLATMEAWRAAGGRYVFAANNGRSASPELVRVDGSPMVLMARAGNDDYLTVQRAGGSDPARLAADQLEAWAKVRDLGGLFIMSYHSNMLARKPTVAAIGHIARGLRADTLGWLTTGDSVAQWWLARHAVRTTVTTSGETAEVRVHNTGAGALPAFTVQLALPDGRIPVASPDVHARRDGTRHVRVPRLGAGAVHVVTVPLEAPADAR